MKRVRNDHGICAKDWDIPHVPLVAGAVVVCSGVGLILCLVNAYTAAEIFPNPVYWAYTHLVY